MFSKMLSYVMLRHRITSFKKKYSRWLKQITYLLFGGIQTPGPLMSMLADKVKLTQYNKHVNKHCAITSLVCCYIGAERNKCLIRFFTENGQPLPIAFPICCS